MTASRPVVFTIGHSTHAQSVFIALLRQYDITALADVRSAPFSRFARHFNKNTLAKDVKTDGIKYVFLGRELGARSNDPSLYDRGRVRYARLAETDLFKRGIARVVHGAEDNRIALMCAEKEPLECHRTPLVARALCERGLDVMHILADGTLEPHEAAMDRLLELTGSPREDLFLTRQDLIADALAKQEEKIAYVDEKMAAEAAGEAP
jgi:uncharacterized protein (DUF488 family)